MGRPGVDSLTHIYFAEKLLKITGGDRSAAVCSLFPQIDRQPAYFHRMYGHPYFQLRRLAPIGTDVYKHGPDADEAPDAYARTRYEQERPRMQSFVREYEEETGTSISPFDPDPVSVLVSYASHTYQDIFNNPMQGFLPHATYPSGKWDLWRDLGGIDFRAVLYEPGNIDAFRREFFGDSLWETRLDPVAVVKAMVQRTAAAAAVPIPDEIVAAAFESLELGDAGGRELADAEAFLVEHEQLLTRLTRQYSTPKVPAGAGEERRGTAQYPVGS
jgi:hypothetical protein